MITNVGILFIVSLLPLKKSVYITNFYFNLENRITLTPFPLYDPTPPLSKLR